MSYCISIINNSDGTVIVDEKNAVAIIGVVNDGERVRNMVYCDCSIIEMAFTLCEMKNLYTDIIKESPFMIKLCNAIQDE